mmetsp:Transcript_18040/g.24766  ORF Transcript_18040/g.24766 Transcript_18040/m.24766 type:complete len:104 (-) Transcript_18040:1600-1911(-)
MMIVVCCLDCCSASMDSCTIRSLVASRAEVASSNNSTTGFLMRALAMAIRCFWPPLIEDPLDPTSVSYPSGRWSMKSCALACLAASTTRARSFSFASATSAAE